MKLSIKKWFIIHSVVMTSSSVMIFIFLMASVVLPSITVTGSNPTIPNKESLELYIILGLGVSFSMLFIGTRNMWRMTNKEKLKDNL